MQAGNAHKMRIHHVYQKETRAGYIKRPLCCGKVLFINAGGKGIETSHRSDKIIHGRQRSAAVTAEKKRNRPYPEINKVKVNRNPRGDKGNLFIKRMIYFCYGYSSGQEGGAELAIEKIVKN
jgi:hypothetical protein